MTSYPRGDVRYLVSQDGTVNDYTYTAYGEKVGTNDNSVNPFGYCGEYFDAETDLVYLRNRYYDPEMHRFITEDPAKDGVNWYAYCNGNPVMFTDPWGLSIYANHNVSYNRVNKFGIAEEVNATDLLLEQVIKATGDTGYYFDGDYLHHKDGAEIVGGSEIARKIINNLLNLTMQIEVQFKDNGNIYRSGKSANKIHINSITNNDEMTAVFMHELAHCYTAFNGIDDKIAIHFYNENDPYKADIVQYIKKQKQEAVAMTIEEQFRNDMGYFGRSHYTDRLIGTNNYGQFPYELTTSPEQIMITNSGKKIFLKDHVIAATLYSYGRGIVDYVLNN